MGRVLPPVLSESVDAPALRVARAGYRIEGKGSVDVRDGICFVGAGRACSQDGGGGGVSWARARCVGRRSWVRRWRRSSGWGACRAPVRAVYEAGPTGFGLARAARAAGIEMMVCSPGAIPRQPGDRVKTDKRDALKLARLHAAGQLRAVLVPDLPLEGLRDLVRCARGSARRSDGAAGTGSQSCCCVAACLGRPGHDLESARTCPG